MFDFMLLLWVYPTALVIRSPTRSNCRKGKVNPRNRLFSHAVLMAIVFCVSIVFLGPSVVHCYKAAVVALMRSNTCLLLWLWPAAPPQHTHYVNSALHPAGVA